MAKYVSRYTGAEIDAAVAKTLVPLTVDQITATAADAGKIVAIGADGKGTLATAPPPSGEIDGGTF